MRSEKQGVRPSSPPIITSIPALPTHVRHDVLEHASSHLCSVGLERLTFQHNPESPSEQPQDHAQPIANNRQHTAQAKA